MESKVVELWAGLGFGNSSSGVTSRRVRTVRAPTAPAFCGKVSRHVLAQFEDTVFVTVLR